MIMYKKKIQDEYIFAKNIFVNINYYPLIKKYLIIYQ